MQITLENDGTKLNFETPSAITFEQLFRAWQLSTGNFEDELTDSAESTSDAIDGPIDSKLMTSATTVAPEHEVGEPDHFDSDRELTSEERVAEKRKSLGQVKADIQCPFCGYTGYEWVRKGNNYVQCRECHHKLFLSWALGRDKEGYTDSHGAYYHAYTEMHFKNEDQAEEHNEFSKMFAKNEDSDRPDSTNTVAEIIDYLDSKNVNHKGVTLKGKLLELVPQTSMENADVN